MINLSVGNALSHNSFSFSTGSLFSCGLTLGHDICGLATCGLLGGSDTLSQDILSFGASRLFGIGDTLSQNIFSYVTSGLLGSSDDLSTGTVCLSLGSLPFSFPFSGRFFACSFKLLVLLLGCESGLLISLLFSLSSRLLILEGKLLSLNS